MKPFIALGAALVLASFLPAQPEKKGAAFDAAKLAGNWEYVSGKKAGDAVEKDHLQGNVVITKDTITMPAGPNEKIVVTFKIDAKASPASIDMEITDGQFKGGKAIGIVMTEGDTLTLCYSPNPDGKRPTKFESTKDNAAHLFVLKKAK